MAGNAPRRAGARWREGAPDFVADVLDNRGATVDRYTVIFAFPYANTGGQVLYLGMSDAPTHPQGFSQWGEISQHAAAAHRYREGKRRIRWLDLPQHIRDHVIARNSEEG
jgi:hypothetical protein